MRVVDIVCSVGRGVLLALPIMVFTSCGETEEKRRTVGYKGKARGNAFLAAERLLESQGQVVDDRADGAVPDASVSTLFLPPSSLNTVGRVKRTLSWVEGGGHLVVMLAGGNKRGNDFSPDRVGGVSGYDDLTPGLEHLLGQLQVKLVDWPSEKRAHSGSGLSRDDWEDMEEQERALLGAGEVRYALGGDKMLIHHWARRVLEYEVKEPAEFGTGKSASRGVGRNTMEDSSNKHLYLSLTRGEGRVSLLADASALRNRFIGYADHAEFVGELVSLSRDGMIVFADGGGDGFFAMVWRYFWMAVLGMAVLTVFWLWKNLPRFGPLQDLPEGGIREFSGQTRGIGRFLWRHKRDDVMLASLRAAVSQKLSLDAQGDNEQAFEQLARRAKMPLESVVEAMTRNHVREPGVMVRVVRNLQHILKTINQR